jgi:hypothetical protein
MAVPGTVPITFEVTIDLNEALRPQFGVNYEGEPYESGPPDLQRAIFDAVVERIARKMVEEAPKDYYPSLRVRVKERLDETMGAQAAEMVEEALAHVVVETDGFGQPKGKPRTFREYMVERIEKWLQEPHKDGSYGGTRQTNAQAIIKNVLDRKFTEELTAAVVAGKKQALAVVKERAADLMGKALGSLAEGEGRCESCKGTGGQHYRNCPVYGQG